MTSPPPNKYPPYATQTYTIAGTAFTYVFKQGVNPNYGLFPPHKDLNGIFSKVAGVYLETESRIEGGLGNGIGTAGIGVDLTQTATLENTSSGTIVGGTNYNGYISGSGVIKGNAGAGVSMLGGTLTNDKGGTIDGGGLSPDLPSTGTAGVGVLFNGSGTVDNSGTISGGYAFAVGGPHGTGGEGVDLGGGAKLNNNASGYITGGSGLYTAGTGLYASGAGTKLYNFSGGKIRGGSVYSNGLHGYKNDTASGGTGAIISSGATLTNNGSITGGSPSSSGSIGVAVNVYMGGTLKNGDTGTAGEVTVASGGTVTNTGILGTVYLNGGTLSTSANLSGDTSEVHGVVLNGGTLTTSSYLSGANGGADIKFGTGMGTVKIESGATFNDNALSAGIANVAGFAAGDTIDIPYLASSVVKEDFNKSTYTLTLNSSGQGELEFGGNFSKYTFAINSYGTINKYGIQGTQITLEPACYLRGTRILTERGEIAIEALKIGDRIVTASGLVQPVRWIGHRRYSYEQVAGDPQLLPIRVSAGALADGVPHRDLWVSPEHALLIDGMLIPALALVNGASIRQESAEREVIYLHLEFDSHTVVIAQGALAESFVDDESRAMFDNAHEYTELYPDAPIKPVRLCAPRVEEGYELETVRRRLARRSNRLAQIAQELPQIARTSFEDSAKT